MRVDKDYVIAAAKHIKMKCHVYFKCAQNVVYIYPSNDFEFVDFSL